MQDIPRTAKVLGFAGVLPFIWGALGQVSDNSVFQLAGENLSGLPLMLGYGVIIFNFMGGCLWGFATRLTSALGYVLSILPALWTLFMFALPLAYQPIVLLIGFIALLRVDYWFVAQAVAPNWWMSLRMALTVCVSFAFVGANIFA